MPTITGAPSRTQQRAAMLDAGCGSENGLGAFAEHEPRHHPIVRPKTNDGGRQPCHLILARPKRPPAVELLALGVDRTAMDRVWRTAQDICPQRDDAALPCPAFAPRTAR